MDSTLERGRSAPAPRPLAISRWLLIVAAMIVMIVAVGGITRLTESGVSITEWKPVSGALPPLSEAAWQAEFDAYRQTPQYIRVNGPAGMTLETYKFIFFWEWFHRLIARSIGLAFALPLAWFWAKGTVPRGYKVRLLVLLAMGGLQGAVGWWMVKSGISTDVRVSHFRLATHLLLALTTMAAIIWTALDLRALARGEPRARLTRWGAAALAVLTVQILLGALVAGLRAGYVAGSGWFNWEAWPLMQGRIWPDGVDFGAGLGNAVLHDPYLLHFLHRWWAWAVVGVLIVLARLLRKDSRPASIAIHSTFGLQIVLGIATVWSGVELWLAVAHQLNGALTLAAATWGAHLIGRKRITT